MATDARKPSNRAEGEHLRHIDDRFDDLLDWAIIARDLIREIEPANQRQAEDQAGLLTWLHRLLTDKGWKPGPWRARGAS